MTINIAQASFKSKGALTARQFGDRFSEKKNVRDYGARGDGIADDWAAIMRAINSGRITLKATSSNATATFTGTISAAHFTGTVAGNNLTINSGLVGNVVVGQTVFFADTLGNQTTRKVLSGSGVNWVLDGTAISVGPEFMQTSAVLAATSVVGTIGINNLVLDSTNASTGAVSSQLTGAIGSDGTYDLGFTFINFAAQAMTTTTNVLNVTSTTGVAVGEMFAFDETTPGAIPYNLDNGISTTISAVGPSTLTLNNFIGLVHAGDVIQCDHYNKGTIWFPPGTYAVSQPVDYSGVNINICFLGVLGASTVVGNFPDYVIRRQLLNDPGGFGGWHVVERLAVINNHATGGGIRMGGCVSGAIRKCVVTANLGIDTADSDVFPGEASLSIAVEDCTLSPGANPAGSLGIQGTANGPNLNCIIAGFDTGMKFHGQEGSMYVAGCRFDLCGVGINPGASSIALTGCLFKNCGIGLLSGAGGLNCFGCRFEGATGTIAGDPQYGIKITSNSLGAAILRGIIVTGQFQQYGIYLEGGENTTQNATLIAVQSFNSIGLGAWRMPPNAGCARYIGCNVPPVFSMANLPAFPLSITSLTWDSVSGLTTLTVPFNISGYSSRPMSVTIVGLSPSGYNGTFSGAHETGVATVQWSQANPGSPTATGSGTAIINYGPAALEGDTYNVSDSDASAWGTNPTVTPGANHAKVRWNGKNWVVMGV